MVYPNISHKDFQHAIIGNWQECLNWDITEAGDIEFNQILTCQQRDQIFMFGLYMQVQVYLKWIGGKSVAHALFLNFFYLCLSIYNLWYIDM